MSTECLCWLTLLSLSCIWLYSRILKLYEKVEHIYFLIGVSDHRLDKLEEKEFERLRQSIKEKCNEERS